MSSARALLGVVAVVCWACGSVDASSSGFGSAQIRIPASSAPGGGVSVGPTAFDAAVDCPSRGFDVADGGPVWSCILAECRTQATACANDCSCNGGFAQALDCIAASGLQGGCLAAPLSINSVTTRDLVQCIVARQMACVDLADAAAIAARAAEANADDASPPDADAAGDNASAIDAKTAGSDSGAADAKPE
jgi:hypothetical protein